MPPGLARVGAAAGCGGLLAMSLPPWGWWPATFVAIALFEALLRQEVRVRRRFGLGFAFGAVWMAIGMGWMWFLTAPGYLIAVAIFAGFHGLAAIPARHPNRADAGTLMLRAGTHTLAEALRFVFPFGGVPLASVAIAQSGGPFIDLGRFGGPILVTAVTFFTGGLLARILAPTGRDRVAAIATALVVAVTVSASVVSFTSATGDTIRLAAIQGGGPQGTLAIDTDPRDVIERHLAATATLQPEDDLDAVVWPENVISTGDVLFADSWAAQAVADEARRLGVPFVVGITERPRPNRFTNAQVVVLPDGRIVDRYDKVRRVPFGEYIPLRGLLEALGAPVDRVPNDAIAGTGPAVLDIDGIRAGVVISWEVFFGGRARDGIGQGGEILLNPTNGSSYTGTVLQTQQIASSRLRAVETGRWVLQVAPTGFSAIISPEGEVLERTAISETAVLVHDLPRREGRTPYGIIGDLPVLGMVLAATMSGPLRSRRRRSPG